MRKKTYKARDRIEFSHRSRVIICALILVLGVSWIAADPGFAKDESQRQMIERYLIPSYITFGGGYDTALPKGGYNDLLFEADLNQHLHYQPLFLKDKSFFKINPRVRLRMLALESSPVRTPSFMPNLTWFVGFGEAQKLYDGDKGLTYYSLMLSHHSNGQVSDFYNADGSINAESGSFSTNFLDFGINRIWAQGLMAQAWTRLSLIWHPGINRNDELDDQYEKVKVAVTSSTTRGPEHPAGYNFEFQYYLSYTLAGLDYTFIPGPGSMTLREKAHWYDRVDWGFVLSTGNEKTGDFRWFLKYDHGYDYYNINFFHPIRRLQIGIMGDPY